MNKAIEFSHHATEQLKYRGTNEPEVIEAISTSTWKPAELDRLDCTKIFAYNNKWNGKHYQNKQVRPIFVDEQEKIVVVTVYVYYF